MNVLPELMLFYHNDDLVWIPGPEHTTRSDGSSSLITSQAYGSTKEYPTDTMLVDESGGKWHVRTPLRNGFHIEGIILEEEGSYDDA